MAGFGGERARIFGAGVSFRVLDVLDMLDLPAVFDA